MTNQEIATHFRTLANLLELLEENPFKIRSYRNAYNTLRKHDRDLASMKSDEIEKIPGVGKAISSKIGELLETGSLNALEKARKEIPPGVEELLNIKGLGPGKIRKLWRGLEVQSPGELLYACKENRLLKLKGFGQKSQSDIISKVEFHLSQQGKFLYAELIDAAKEVLATFSSEMAGEMVTFTGKLRRIMPVLEEISLLATGTLEDWKKVSLPNAELEQMGDNYIRWTLEEKYPVCLHLCPAAEFGNKQLELTGPEAFTDSPLWKDKLREQSYSSEKKLFNALGVTYIKPEFRDWESPENALELSETEILSERDILGVVHAHSNYSDGINSLEEMVDAAREKGFKYLAITDHSAYAAYAGGLREKDVLEQWAEIDRLNEKRDSFRVIKGIEADILPNGDMDYGPELLSGFELVIASVHSVLKMDRERATDRLIKAIENPSVHMLGHPTGRLLLSRPGYPLDMPKILDACAQNGVAIEINANPHRLDLDWQWIRPAAERGIKFSINPDAHSTMGIDDIKYGISVAQKGGMLKSECLNTLEAADFLSSLKK
ncbi:MAG: DNA polymerase/3'-5' exonuclease PolX [Saprospirales bacterium]|nr:MAG: DNA polymerase/3'-5' exonuclease PolX [Saprospirales bacterium]